AEQATDNDEHTGIPGAAVCSGSLNHKRWDVAPHANVQRTNTMKKMLFALAASAAVLIAGGASAQDKVKACWIYVGPIGDFGYSYQHHQGLLDVEEHFGDKVETAYLESVPEGADAERAIERFARSGCDIIFTT